DRSQDRRAEGAGRRADPHPGRPQPLHPVRVVPGSDALHQAAPSDPYPRVLALRSRFLRRPIRDVDRGGDPRAHGGRPRLDPGWGGEILVQEVRDRVAKKKAGADRWLEVMETAHRLALKTSVTMMYGLGETLADRVEHLFRVREVQGRSGGFTAFICWPLQPEHTELAHFEKTDAVTYLRTQAIARIVLDNVPNIQASWV